MRHGKHRYLLGRTKEHREALMANLAVALFRYGKIRTTLAKAKALRPFAEKLITMAKKAHLSEDRIKKLHYLRLVISRIRDADVAAVLFNERAAEFVNRNGGYTRIYKIVQRVGDAAKMAIIELIPGDDVGYSKSKKRRSSAARSKKSVKSNPEAVDAASEKLTSNLGSISIIDNETGEISETPDNQ